jgi:hypothetical protein
MGGGQKSLPGLSRLGSTRPDQAWHTRDGVRSAAWAAGSAVEVGIPRFV